LHIFEWSDLGRVIGLPKVPHFTTLYAAAKRLLRKARADATLDTVLDPSQTRETRLRILTHNLVILWRRCYVLYRAAMNRVTDGHLEMRRWPNTGLLCRLLQARMVL
jgi:hypothetical protein